VQHLHTPDDCTVFYENKGCSDSALGFSANLDVDDTTAFGPETTTILHADKGKFSYYVHIYSSGATWSNIAANVKVYDKAGLVYNVNNPSSECGTLGDLQDRWWHVVDYEPAQRKFTLINEIKSSTTAISAHAIASATLGSPPSCSCGIDSNDVSDMAPLGDKYIAAELGQELKQTVGLCWTEAQEVFTNASTIPAAARGATSAVNTLAERVSAKVAARFEIVKEVRDEFKLLLATAPAASVEQQRPCCELGACSTCRIQQAFSEADLVDLSQGCLRYAALVSADAKDGRNDVPEAELSALVAVQTKIAAHLQADSTLKWLYVGTSSGAYAIGPKTERAPSKCQSYDTRHRPWYVEACSGAKSVVILLDARGGSSNFLEAKQGAMKVIETLNSRDEANVIIFGGGSDVRMMVAGAATLDCHGEQLLKMTEENGAILQSFVENAEASTSETAADYESLFFRAQSLMPDENKKRVMILISLFTGAGDSTMFTTGGSLLSVPFFSYTPFDQSNALASIAVQHTTIDASTVGVLPALYHENAMLQTGSLDSEVPIASALYADYSGLGLVTTVALPLGSVGNVEAVVGLDVPIMDLVSDLVMLNGFELSYAFMVDTTGFAIWHPALPSPSDGTLTTIHLLDLEPGADFENIVYPAMFAESAGSKTILTEHLIPVGDVRYSGFHTLKREVTYAWQTVPNTDFIIVMAWFADEDGERAELADISSNNCVPWHDEVAGNQCSAESQVFFAASAFTDGFAWMQTEVTPAVTKTLLDTISTNAGAPPTYVSAVTADKSSSFSATGVESPADLFQSAISEMKLTAELEECWISSADSNMLYQYIGTSSGMIRVYPRGDPISKHYDPTHRPWYIAATANYVQDAKIGAGTGKYFKATISTPYVDAFGAGIIMTISKAVQIEGRVVGVAAMDVRSSYLQQLVAAKVPECSTFQCIFVNKNGLVVLNNGIAPTDEHLFLSEVHSELAQDLLDAGIMVRDSCIDYGDAVQRYSYRFDAETFNMLAANSRSLTCGSYAVREVSSTNLYVFVLTDACDKGWEDCLACTAENCRDSVATTPQKLCMPCNCLLFHDTCELTYTLGSVDEIDGGSGDAGTSPSSSVDACPAAPPSFTVSDSACTSNTAVEDNDVYDTLRNNASSSNIVISFVVVIVGLFNAVAF
jgi:hypothetical protein